MNLSLIIRSDCSPHRVDETIFSVLPQDAPSGSYDGRAKLYDAVVGSKIYNRLLWGTSTDNYQSFARRAVSNRSMVLVDRSAGMLRAAAQRIWVSEAPSSPENMAYIQADLFDLPFRENVFSTVLSMGMLHLFEKKKELINNLLDFVTKSGKLYLTVLVDDRKTGAKYLSLLHQMGEVAKPHSFQSIKSLIATISQAKIVEASLEGSMAYFIITKTKSTG